MTSAIGTAAAAAAAATAAVPAVKPHNLLPGLVLFREAVPEAFQAELVALVEEMLVRGRAGELAGKTYSAPPKKWQGKGQSREMLQFGVYTNSNRVFDAPVMPLPDAFERLLDSLEASGVVRDDCDGDGQGGGGDGEGGVRPDSCTVNVYGPGMWLPPHVDSEHFARPFFTVSLVSEQAAVFAERSAIEERSEGDWHLAKGEEAPSSSPSSSSLTGAGVEFPMPPGSVLRVGGAAAGPRILHALPPATSKRISLTFRRVSTATRALWSKQRHAKEAEAKLSAERRRERKRAKKAARKAERKEAKRKRAALSSEDSRSKKVLEAKPEPVPVPEGLLVEMDVDDAATIGQEKSLPHIEREHVQQVYDSIAPQWHGTRYKQWPRVASFCAALPPGSLIADLGCGNGKNLKNPTGGMTLGCDFSVSLLAFARNAPGTGPGKGAVFAADCTALPIRPGIFDAAISIAVLHHISTRSRRVALMREAVSTIRVGGTVLFYAWAFEQKRGGEGGDKGVREGARRAAAAAATTTETTTTTATGKSATQGVSNHIFRSKDVFVPFHYKGESDKEKEVRKVEGKGLVFQRYCHVYEKGELESLAKELGTAVRIVDSWYDTGNWALVLERRG